MENRISPFRYHENYQPWMTFKGHYSLCYANRVAKWHVDDCTVK